jgi:hypothetical protein
MVSAGNPHDFPLSYTVATKKNVKGKDFPVLNELSSTP